MPIARVGSEFIVNTTPDGYQLTTSVTALANGRFMAVWASFLGDDEENSVFGRIYNADGTPAGDDFLLSTTTLNDQDRPTVIGLTDGRFLATWESYDEPLEDGTNVHGRFFSADGAPLGDNFIINTTTAGSHYYISASALADGRFAVTFKSSELQGDSLVYKIRARILDADGTAIGNDFIVNTTEGVGAGRSRLTALADDRFVVMWRSDDGGDGSGTCIRARIFNADGTPVDGGGDFIVNQTSEDDQVWPDITTLADGGFVATWASGNAQDPDWLWGVSIVGRVFNADGAPAGSEFVVDDAHGSSDSSVTALADGRFVVTWTSYAENWYFDPRDGSGTCIMGQVFNADGTPAGNDGAFIVNATTDASQHRSSATAMNDGRFVVAWESYDVGDGSDGTLRSQTFDPTRFEGTGNHDIWNGGNLIDTINGAGGDDAFYGKGGNDIINGGDGNDTLDGGMGADALDGGDGDDTYFLDNAGDTVADSSGIDTIVATFSRSLGAFEMIENLTLAGSANINGTGNSLANTLTGNTGKNKLTGGAGNDILDGGAGADTLDGGDGDDTYFLDNTGDTVADSSGTDTIAATISCSLVAFAKIENLTLAGSANINGTGNGLANMLIGNAGRNTLTGGAGNDTLNGGGGADILNGGAGNDVYVLRDGIDSVKDSSGIDTITSTISRSLEGYAKIENLTLLGSDYIDGRGNNRANTLTGNTGENLLDGGAGNDRLVGGSGADNLMGGAGADIFVFTKLQDTTAAWDGRDTIVDFSRAQRDRIDLSAIDANTTTNGDQAFGFIGTAAFSQHAGELRYEKISGETLISGDVDGDSVADFAILVEASFNFKSADFLL